MFKENKTLSIVKDCYVNIVFLKEMILQTTENSFGDLCFLTFLNMKIFILGNT